ncbi:MULTISPECIES: hypothetical protein [unclassified Mesorhizobium]|uniref:hypothetical protein n=1 Tax=unclassified Mesorhizobium TaxID=325217 RepID=UPI00143F57C5|nr:MULTISPECIES: hypothetical protein [unclassified Mesorhizobium]
MAAAKASDLHPQAKVALTYQALVLLGRIDESIARIERALGELAEANRATSA